MADSRVIQFLIKLGLDKQSISDVLTGAKDVEAVLDDLNSKRREIGDEELAAIRKEFDELLPALKKIQDEYDKFERQIKRTREEAQRLNETAEKLSSISQKAAVAGAAITAPLLLAAKKYVDYAGNAEQASSRWLLATRSLEESQMRIGRIVAQTVLPAMETAADAAEAFAKWSEKNPLLVKGLLAGGAGLLGLGALGTTVAQGIKLVADVKFLSAAALQNTAADKMLAAAGLQAGKAIVDGKGSGLSNVVNFAKDLFANAVPYLKLAAQSAAPFLPVVGGAAFGAAGYEALANTQIGQNAGLAKLNQFATVGAKTLGDIFGKVSTSLGLLNETDAERKTAVLTALIGNITGAIDEQSPIWQRMLDALKADETGDDNPPILSAAGRRKVLETAPKRPDQNPEALAAFEAFERGRNELVARYEQERSAIVARASQERIALEQNRARVLANFARAEAEAERDYYNSRTDVVRKAGVDARRAEEDHQRRLMKLREDHEENVENLVNDRDALGLVRENRNYEKQRREEEQQHDIEMRRKNEDVADQLRMMERQFQIQRERRQQELQRTLADFEAQKKLIDAAEKQALDELKTTQEKELQALQASLREHLNAINTNILKDQAAVEKASADLHARFLKWLNDASAGYIPNTPSRKTNGDRLFGGYMERRGTYNVAEDDRAEFVMNANTTRAAETIVGGRLNQDNLLRAMMTQNVYLPGGVGSIRAGRKEVRARNKELTGLLVDFLESTSRA